MKRQDAKLDSKSLLLLLKQYGLNTRKACPSHVRLQNYVRGLMSPQEKFRYEKHCSVCAACREEIKSIRNKDDIKYARQDRSLKTALHSTVLVNIRKTLKKELLQRDDIIDSLARFLGAAPVKNCPRGIFLYVGPNGSGKTFLAKKLAQALYGEKYLNHFLREYMKPFYTPSEAFRICGTPGYSDDLVSRMINAGEGIVLLEDIEEAHPAVWKLFYQYFKEGEAGNIQGRSIDLSGFLFIMTTTFGCGEPIPVQEKKVGFLPEPESPVAQQGAKQKLIRQFEFDENFLELIDEIYQFPTLDDLLYKKIIEKELLAESKRKQKRFVYDSGFSSAISAAISRKFGTRQIYRTLRKLIFAPLEEFIEHNQFQWKAAKQVCLKHQSGKEELSPQPPIPIKVLTIGTSRRAFNFIRPELPDAQYVTAAGLAASYKKLQQQAVDLVCVDIDSCESGHGMKNQMRMVEQIKQLQPEAGIIVCSSDDKRYEALEKLADSGVTVLHPDRDTAHMKNFMRDIISIKKEFLISYHRGGQVRVLFDKSSKEIRLFFTPL